jgi:hypothetical protein
MDPRRFEITTARTTGTFTFAGTRLRQRVFTATLRSARSGWMDPLAGQWFGLLPFYYHAPESEFDSVDRLLAGIGRSFRIDPSWRQRQAAAAAQQQALANIMFQQTMASNRQAQHNFMDAQHRIWADQQHVSEGITQSWQYHNAALDHAMQQWSDTTLGVTHVMNPDTGAAHTVRNDFDQYWATNDGTKAARGRLSPTPRGITSNRSSCRGSTHARPPTSAVAEMMATSCGDRFL